MQDPPVRAIQKYLRGHPEVREILENFLVSSAQYERALRAVASILPPPLTFSKLPFEAECRGDLSEAN